MKQQISREYLLRIAEGLRELPTQEDIIAFLDSDVSTTDLHAVLAFLDAARAMKGTPEYKNQMQQRTELRHCVRCHRSYTDATNIGGSCIIRHVFSKKLRDLGKRDPSGAKIYTHLSECCDGVELDTIYEDEYLNLEELGHCFEGKHTTQVITVEFGEIKGNGYNGISIMECVMDSTTRKCSLSPYVEKPILVSDSIFDSDEGMSYYKLQLAILTYSFENADKKFVVRIIRGRVKKKSIPSNIYYILFIIFWMIDAKSDRVDVTFCEKKNAVPKPEYVSLGEMYQSY